MNAAPRPLPHSPPPIAHGRLFAPFPTKVSPCPRWAYVLEKACGSGWRRWVTGCNLCNPRRGRGMGRVCRVRTCGAARSVVLVLDHRRQGGDLDADDVAQGAGRVAQALELAFELVVEQGFAARAAERIHQRHAHDEAAVAQGLDPGEAVD